MEKPFVRRVNRRLSDARLAAIAIEHGAEVCSCDTDDARFPGVRWTDPMA